MVRLTSIIALTIIASAICGNLQRTNELEAVPLAEISAFVNGFVKGVDVFTTLPHEAECWTKTHDAQIAQDVIDAYTMVKNFDFKGNVLVQLKTITERVADLFARLEASTAPCAEWNNEIAAAFRSIKDKFLEEGYLAKAAQHGGLNIGQFIEKGTAVGDAFKTKNYAYAGFMIGDLARFGLWWELKH